MKLPSFLCPSEKDPELIFFSTRFSLKARIWFPKRVSSSSGSPLTGARCRRRRPSSTLSRWSRPDRWDSGRQRTSFRWVAFSHEKKSRGFYSSLSTVTVFLLFHDQVSKWKLYKTARKRGIYAEIKKQNQAQALTKVPTNVQHFADMGVYKQLKKKTHLAKDALFPHLPMPTTEAEVRKVRFYLCFLRICPIYSILNMCPSPFVSFPPGL